MFAVSVDWLSDVKNMNAWYNNKKTLYWKHNMKKALESRIKNGKEIENIWIGT